MKKINNYLALFLCIAVLFSCDTNDDNGLGKENPESGWLQFDGTNPSSSYFNEDLVNDQVATIEVPFRFTAPINKSNLVMNYNIVDVEGSSSSVISTSGSATIPANTRDGVITININLENLESNIFTDYTFDIVMASNDRGVSMGIADDFASTYRVSLAAPCMPPALAGMYSVYTEYGFHDFLPDFSTHTMDMEVVEVGDQTYFVQDLSGGLYSVGPYVAAYGTGADSFDAVFSTVCNQITWSGQSDPWGADRKSVV